MSDSEGGIIYFIVLSNPTPGDDDEYNRWYSRRHITDVLTQIPGVRSAQRFQLATDQRSEPPYQFRYMALYRVEKERAAEVFAELKARSGTDVMPVSGTFDPNYLALVFEPITPRLTPQTAAAYTAGA